MRKFLAAALAALLTLSLCACGTAPPVSSGSGSGKDAPDLDGLFTELSAWSARRVSAVASTSAARASSAHWKMVASSALTPPAPRQAKTSLSSTP